MSAINKFRPIRCILHDVDKQTPRIRSVSDAAASGVAEVLFVLLAMASFLVTSFEATRRLFTRIFRRKLGTLVGFCCRSVDFEAHAA